MAILSILGLYNYDASVFDNLRLPVGIDKNIVTQSILLECAELEFVYPRMPSAKLAIGIWSQQRLPQWQKLYNTTNLDYNPIENYNRTDTYTSTDQETANDNETLTQTAEATSTTDASGSNIANGTEKRTTTSSGTSTDTQSSTSNDTGTNSKTGSVTHSVVGFNDAASVGPGMTPESQDSTIESENGSITRNNNSETSQEIDGTSTEDYTKNETVNRTDNTSTESENNSESAREKTSTIHRENSHTLTAKGNIGVTTTQQMIQQEREVAMFDMVATIVTEFKYRFCILVY